MVGPAFTLDQLRVFLAVVETGSFSGAARKLRRAQSAVSYGVATLERQLGVTLFDRDGLRPTTTEAGQALLVRARGLVVDADELAATAQRMSEGLEPRVTLAAEVLYPMPLMVGALAAFQKRYPSVPLLLRTEAMGAVAELVLNGTCSVGVSVAAPFVPKELEQIPLTTVQLVAVVAPSHELARYGQDDQVVPARVLKRHTQLVLTDRSKLSEGYDAGVVGGPNWRIADLGAKHQFLLAGFGWGTMPLQVVARDIEKKRLVRLRLADDDVRASLCVLFRPNEPPGPATRWLLDLLGTRCSEAQKRLASEASPALPAPTTPTRRERRR
ncbi:MAG TPA: LysR family transcriptional regulator [Polyangia bacterium]|nr:LysR family transcriptional regulator [Polyangia bacterium]